MGPGPQPASTGAPHGTLRPRAPRLCALSLSPFVSLCLTLPVSVSLNMDSACCFFCCFCSCLRVCRCSLCKGDASLSSAALDHPPDLRLSCSLNASRSGLMSPEKLFSVPFPYNPPFLPLGTRMSVHVCRCSDRLGQQFHVIPASPPIPLLPTCFLNLTG